MLYIDLKSSFVFRNAPRTRRYRYTVPRLRTLFHLRAASTFIPPRPPPESIAKREGGSVNMRRQSGRNNRPIGLRAKRERSGDNVGIFANSRAPRADVTRALNLRRLEKPANRREREEGDGKTGP